MKKFSSSAKPHAPRARAFAFCAVLLALCVSATLVGAPVGARQKPAAQKDVTVYTCPMHPSVKSAAPGKCPKCGMALRPAARDEGAAGQSSPAKANEAAATPGGRKTIPDLELLDQNGKRIHFYTDLVKGKTVVINFIFTTCTTICPPLGATFARVQKDLGADRVGKDVHFISVSVDPVTDTPERLKAWGEKFHAGPGWTFVTGEKPRVDELLNALSASSARREDHSPGVLIINDATGQWTRTYGLAKPSQLVKLINDARAGAAAASVSQ